MSVAQRAVRDRINGERTVELARYEEEGCGDRFEWIEALATEHGLALGIVIETAELLGPEEDFDGLVVACEDGAAGIGMAACPGDG